MIKPFVDAMAMSPEGGHALFESGGNAAAEADPPLSQLMESEPSVSEPGAHQHTMSDISSHKVPASVTYNDNTVFLLIFHAV